MQIPIHECKGGAQVIMVLLQAAEAHLHESEHALENAEGMLDSGPHPGFGSVLAAFDLVDAVLV